MQMITYCVYISVYNSINILLMELVYKCMYSKPYNNASRLYVMVEDLRGEFPVSARSVPSKLLRHHSLRGDDGTFS